jgi:hypothetical protein
MQAASTQAVSERYAADTAQAQEVDQRATAEAEGVGTRNQQAVPVIVDKNVASAERPVVRALC